MEQDFVAQTALDQMVGSDRTQLLKAAIPYLPQRGQQLVSLYAKLSELMGAIKLFGRAPSQGGMQAASLPSRDPLAMLTDIRRFCYGGSRRQLDQMVDLFSMIQILSAMGDPGFSQAAPQDHTPAKDGGVPGSQADTMKKEDHDHGAGLEEQPEAGRDE
ncbi:MAG: hypothetical protein Q4D55_01375 [Eubacteriales bacterium]|nr:hypothetical protein [Eubacteriales bacterium]